MIAILSDKDFNSKYIDLINFIFEKGIKKNNYYLISSERFSNLVVYNLELKNNPMFNISLNEKSQFEKIVEFTKQYPLLMYVKN